MVWDGKATPRVAISTILTPGERLQVDAAGEGVYTALHRETLSEVLQDIRQGRANAILVSVICCEGECCEMIAKAVREIPQIPTVALLSQVRGTTPNTLLQLGKDGIQQLVDVRDPTGWGALRNTLRGRSGRGVQQVILARLMLDVGSVSEDCWAFFQSLFLVSPYVSTVCQLSHELRVSPSTLMSRFFRAGLPAPKQYLAMARLVRAAFLFENQGFSISNVANHLDYSSPQSLGRHIRSLMQMTAVEFRRHFTGERMLDTFREQLVLPYVSRLQSFRPLHAPPAWMAQRSRQKRY